VNDEILVLDAGTILSPYESFSPGRVIIRRDLIESAGPPSEIKAPEGAGRAEYPQSTLVPGFIDPHVHGCGGFDVMDATQESMNTISKMLAKYGTTSFLPTTISAHPDVLTSSIERLARAMHSPLPGAKALGIHLEGPFINVSRRGTHQSANVRVPDPALLTDWVRKSGGQIKLLTMAPELAGAASLASHAQKSGIIVGMGHSDATFEETVAAIEAGCCYAVHTFNAMRPFSHRDPGIVGTIQ
jgi:N-acetylglucosamine-6-phosphate deacetylase